MDGNEQVISRFYSAFQQLDAVTMNNCYSTDAVFSDPVFGILQGREITAMWEMLCSNAKNFSLDFSAYSIAGSRNTRPVIGWPVILFQRPAAR